MSAQKASPDVDTLSDLEHLDTKTVAIKLCVSESKVKILAKTGQIPAFKLGRDWRFPKKELTGALRRKLEKHLKEALA